MKNVEIAVVGAGAAGLMAAIAAARVAPGARVCALDGAARLGAKILIAGGGRCNVTHRQVEARDFNGSTPAAIRRILRGFDVGATRAFFEAEGVMLKEEPTGKLFPVSDRARDVLDALLAAARRAGVALAHPCRVAAITPDDEGFVVRHSGASGGAAAEGAMRAATVILATGGRSVPKTGSDGSGYALATSLGLPLTPRLFPALVPLLLPDGHLIRSLSGLTTDARLTVVSGTGRHLRVVEGSVLCTHTGLSGPAVLDVSRHWQAAVQDDPGAGLLLGWIPGVGPEAFDRRLRDHGPKPVRRALAPLPERLAEAVCHLAEVSPDQSGATLDRESRRRLVAAATAWRVPVTGTRGFEVAEVTAGGVPLAALTPGLEARMRPGVFVCGELCDVDGRIGGFNFQWAWASGTAAGVAAASRIVPASTPVSG
ncbi:flavoprotein [Luteitalea sp. TBR-22]|uniref:NAD(P)/FAD-dependent oxidoreductase n=1 Tax=Luteitalea sp. TBR-22 TaxID=2802971 RepID=UPI001AF6F233|nr:aminoacetone oxidase family FAD-binding enzyme [Luteitalea sp. TBR-22]BCS35351.1 flavoprotein [Luteitalea sp. TBR-22]